MRFYERCNKDSTFIIFKKFLLTSHKEQLSNNYMTWRYYVFWSVYLKTLILIKSWILFKYPVEDFRFMQPRSLTSITYIIKVLIQY